MQTRSKHILLTLGNDYQIAIDPVKIIRFQYEHNYTVVYLINQKHIVSKSLIQIEKATQEAELPFVRVHRTHIINLDHLKSLKKGKPWTLTMDDGTTIIISRRKQTQIADLIDQHYVKL